VLKIGFFLKLQLCHFFSIFMILKLFFVKRQLADSVLFFYTSPTVKKNLHPPPSPPSDPSVWYNRSYCTDDRKNKLKFKHNNKAKIHTTWQRIPPTCFVKETTIHSKLKKNSSAEILLSLLVAKAKFSFKLCTLPTILKRKKHSEE